MLKLILDPKGAFECASCRTGHYFMICKKCKVMLRMGNGRIQYCPKCKEQDLRSKLDAVLCCNECQKPLAVTLGRGTYCEHCDYHPSMQDIFLWYFSDKKCPT